ncbi:energy-coupling factor transporter transmembrane component T [Enterococcus crotali]|uniref:energy-coupling factor transporter transmembrane component T n=1 Tax=Enterococcus crotali TaxID=1453587 RepID=UPI00046FD2EF|nr:energy-coupling factor transporter transmembrane component T [Enterococcus crotali]
MNKSLFRQSHPLVISCYYIVILLIVMSSTNPVIIGACFLGSLLLQLLNLKGKSKKIVLYPLIFCLVITITNPLFVHRGATILFFLFNKPITMEAFVYGFFMGLMIVTVIYLFQNFQTSVESEQFFYLFGKRFPKTVMILTLVFRFIPLLQQYFQELNQVQKTVQRTQKSSFKERAAYGFDLFGNLFSWSLENAMDTADSMKARGYGSKTKSSRLSYSWRKTDTLWLILIFFFCSFFIFRMIKDRYVFNYYPYFDNIYSRIQQDWSDYLLILVVACLPLLKRLREVFVWSILKSRI